MSDIMNAIEAIGRGFDEFKKINDQRLAEEAAGNLARSQELQATLDKISTDLDKAQSEKAAFEKRMRDFNERVEIVEASNSRPGKTIADKLNDEHKALFNRYLRSGCQDSGAVEELKRVTQKGVEMKVMSVGSNVDGGFAVPTEFSRAIDNKVLNTSDILNHVKVVQVSTSDYAELVSVNALGTGWTAEGGTRSAQNTPELLQRKPTWGGLYTLPSVRNWALEDIAFNVEDFIIQNAGEAFGVALSTAIYSGNGSGAPTGITNGAPVTTDDYASPARAAAVLEYIPIPAAGSSPFTTAGITANSLIDLVGALRRGYHNNAKFAFNRTTQSHIRKLTDSYGQYLWQPSFQAGMPDNLLGYPTFLWMDLGNPTVANAFPVVFGDFNRGYTIATRTGMQVIRNPFSTPGTTVFHIEKRYGGCVTNSDALKVLKVALS